MFGITKKSYMNMILLSMSSKGCRPYDYKVIQQTALAYPVYFELWDRTRDGVNNAG